MNKAFIKKSYKFNYTYIDVNTVFLAIIHSPIYV
jgi:hypothetical protein